MTDLTVSPCAFILDDSTEVLEFVESALGAKGFTVETFSHSEALLKRLAEHRPDVILVDIRMPEMSGLQVFREIREQERNIPIIVISASEKQEDAVEALRLGAFDFLRKPLRDFVLLNTVNRALAGHAEGASPPLAAAAENVIPRQEGRLAVLLADDDQSNRILIEAYLRNTSFRLVLAKNGAESLERFEAEAFDVVLMDMKMPIMDGLTATRRLREIEMRLGRPRTPVIALTAHALQEQIQASLDAGCDAHITKPIMRETLLSHIHELTKNLAAPGPPETAPPPLTPSIPDNLLPKIPRYIELRWKDLESLRAALASGDLGATGLIGHNLHGAGASYSFTALTEIGREIERGSEAGDKDAVLAATTEFATFLSGLSSRFEDQDNSSSQDPSAGKTAE